MGNDWTFQAKDGRSGATHTIDRRWQQWGPATDPFHNEGGEWKGRFERAEDCDERLHLDPDGPYVLAWRIDESTSYYASDYRYYCDYMTAQQALHWFIRQRIRPPDELTAKLNIQIQKWPGDAQPESMDQREFWELGKSVSNALSELVSAVCEVFDDAGEFDESYLDRAQARLDRAALALLDALPQFGPTDDPFWSAWIKPPAYCDRLLDALLKVDDAAKYLVKEMGLSRARDAAFWKDAMKHLSVLHESLDNAVRWVEAYPPLDRELYWESRRNLEERQTTGLLAAVQAAPATEAQPAAVEAPEGEARAVEKATESKAPKRKRQRRKLLSERGLTPIQIETYQIWAECKGNVSETARRLGKDRKTVQETLDAAKTKLGKNATKHITTGFRHDRRGQADVDADGDRRLA